VAALGKDIMRDWRRWSRLERWLGVAILMLALLSVPAAVFFERDAGVPIATEAIAGPEHAN
jgi:predicted alpha/beta hydrolase